MAAFNQLAVLTLGLLFLTVAAADQPPPLTSRSFLDAAETLANSGYAAMSLSLQLLAPILPISSANTAATIFAPPDDVFVTAGQPSVEKLLLHLSPLSLPPSSLFSFPFSAKIPTLYPSHHLTVTNLHSPGKISINNVNLSEPPIFDDGLVLVYSIDNFFDSNFTLTDPPTSVQTQDMACLRMEQSSLFQEAGGVLRSRGYSIMASFLDLQLMGFFNQAEENVRMTIFAPIDEELVGFSGDFPGYFSLLMRHVIPCTVNWNDLSQMDNETEISGNAMGFNVIITRDVNDEIMMVNGVHVIVPNLYNNEWLVIHGIRGVIPLPESVQEEMGFGVLSVPKNIASASIAPGRSAI